MQINPYSIPPFISSILILSLGTFVYFKNRHSYVNATFVLLSFSMFMWLFFESVLFSIKSPDEAILLAKIDYIGVSAIPISAYIFARGLINLKTSILLYGFLFTFFVFINFITFKTNLIINGVHQYRWGYFPSLLGRLYILYLFFWFGFYLLGIYLTYRFSYGKKSTTYSSEQRNRIKYGFWVFIVGFVGIADFLPKLGIEIYPFGYVLTPLFWIIITCAIMKHHLMDINIAIKKGLVYSILATVITAGYFIFVISLGRLFQGLLGYQSFLVNLIAVFTIAVLFNPLRNKIQRFLDKRFFKGTLESLAEEKERLKQELFQTEKLAYVGGLASSIVHEIKNPLTVLKTFIEYLPQKANEPEFKEKIEKFLPQEIKRIENVVHQLLDLAKPRQPVFKQINIINTIDTTLSLLENNLKSKRIEVKKDYIASDLMIQGDEEQLRQVFLNLFLNSIQAMNDGGVLTISINLSDGSGNFFNADIRKSNADTRRSDICDHPRAICENLRSKSNSHEFKSVQICVQDSGQGISEENLKKLFTPFFTTKKDGVGLGLTITQEIIKQHNGNIKVESKINQGTRFIINLPI